MKKIIILSLTGLALLFSSIVMAGEERDKKALESSIQKSNELNIELNLTKEQKEKVQEILYVSFRDLKLINLDSKLTREQKIPRYTEINKKAHLELQKILTTEQYDKFVKPERGK